jgi:hypothetical protein
MIIACAVTALAVSTGTATAAKLITSKDIAPGAVQARNIDTDAVALNRLSPGVRSILARAGKPGAVGLSGKDGGQGLTGDTGAKGDTGATGPKGDTGAPGSNGVDGAKGDKGATGNDGAQGPIGPVGPAGPTGAAGAAGKDGVVAPLSASLATPKAIANIGGPINAGYTDLNTSKTLPAGTYIVTVDAAFESATAGDPTVEVYPQVSLWIDKNHDGVFKWQDGEGDISPNAIMPVAANRHISTSGITQVTLTETTKVGLVAFGYTSTQQNERSGEINVVRAVLGALPVASAQ